ncbi:hypothetical protein K458DRAFT_485078 [Lentithecium fluviatile CBS 122367]|uniref:Rhodopsin domain-containing protein n=1 Tax=Lentithecium fluviatile CBS 122367 TaxID=1168545 RepID=A0A6G1JBJ1_9PLEO|nr:hypothetical protein K458DRAFT_485078 [Lentithecium fluviatile CBS 122367]
MAGDFPNLDSSTISQWPQPNLVDPIMRSWLSIYSITLTVITTLIVSARLWTQVRNSAFGFGLDDAFISGAWMFSILLGALCLLGTINYGFDKHIWDVPSTLYSGAALIQWLSEGAFTISVCLMKTSVLIFYRRLEPPCTGSFKKIIYVFIAFTAGYTLACLLTGILLCQPVSAYWAIPEASTVTGRTCAGQGIYYLLHGTLGTFSTFYTIAIPFLVLRNIPLSQSQRNALNAVSVVALSVVGAGVARTVFLFRLADSPNGDATWNGFNVFVCAQLECQLAIICASLPSLHTYFTPNPSVPIVYYTNNTKHGSIVSRVSSSLSSQIRRLSMARTASPKNAHVSEPRPRAVEIPQWEFETLESPRYAGCSVSPVDEITYEQYVRGQFGPPAPPKDSRALFDQYRREHGEMF